MDILTIFYSWVTMGYNAIFYLLPGVMRSIAFSLLLMTVGKCIAKQHGWKFFLARVLLSLFYVGWGIYEFDIMTILTIPEQIIESIGILLIGFGLAILYWIKSLSILGHRIINYFTMWVFYFGALAFFMVLDFNAISIGFSIFYLVLSIILIYITHNEVRSL